MMLPAARIRALVGLLREIREIQASGGDVTAHAAEGVVRLVGADAGGLVLMPGPTASAGSIVSTALFGFASSHREVDGFYRQPQSTITDVAASALVATDPGGNGVCRTRRQLLRDRDWYRSVFVAEFRRRWRLDDSIYGATRAACGNYAGIGLFRAWGSKPFEEEDAQIAELFAEGSRGAVFPATTPPARSAVRLSRRQQQTLEHLLAGASAKQIAGELDLSIHTVGDYIKAIYRAHGVSSRGELLAAVLSRR